MTETLKLRIVPLHPLPFTPADVFFISLGGLDFPHVLPSSSSRLPRASHNKPACLGGRAGRAADMCAGRASGCFSAPAQAPVAGAEGQPQLSRWAWRAGSLPTGLLCWAPAETFSSLFHRAHCASDNSPSTCGFLCTTLCNLVKYAISQQVSQGGRGGCSPQVQDVLSHPLAGSFMKRRRLAGTSRPWFCSAV